MSIGSVLNQSADLSDYATKKYVDDSFIAKTNIIDSATNNPLVIYCGAAKVAGNQAQINFSGKLSNIAAAIGTPYSDSDTDIPIIVRIRGLVVYFFTDPYPSAPYVHYMVAGIKA